MKRFIGYARDNGLISVIDVEFFEGELYAGSSQLWLTDEAGPDMSGWPEEGPTVIARTGSGREVYIPIHCLGHGGAEKDRLFACERAERVLKYVPVGEDRPRRAIEVARRFAVGEATASELDHAFFDAWVAADELVGDAAWAARDAARAASSDLRVNFLRGRR